jgi:DNA-binding LacI/PurR family transcriptional regulator
VQFTLSDVAPQAGVSRSTVSRVLNEGERVSHEIRATVLSVVSRFNYKPDINGVTLRRGKGRVLIKRGIQMPYATNFGVNGRQ